MSPFEQQVRKNTRAILDGKVQPSEVTGSTSVRCAIGLVIRSLECMTTLSDTQAWDYLDYGSARLVRDLRAELCHELFDWWAAEERAGRRV